MGQWGPHGFESCVIFMGEIIRKLFLSSTCQDTLSREDILLVSTFVRNNGGKEFCSLLREERLERNRRLNPGKRGRVVFSCKRSHYILLPTKVRIQ